MCTGGLQGDFIRHSDQILGQECTGCIEVVAEVEKEEETSRRDDDRSEWTGKGSAQVRRES